MFLKLSMKVVAFFLCHPVYQEGGGGTSIIEGGQGMIFTVINIGTEYLNRPNWQLAGSSFYYRVTSQPTMFLTGPRSRHQRRQGCHSKFSFLPTTHAHFPLLFPYTTPIGQVLHTQVNAKAMRPARTHYERLKPPAVGGFPYEWQP